MGVRTMMSCFLVVILLFFVECHSVEISNTTAIRADDKIVNQKEIHPTMEPKRELWLNQTKLVEKFLKDLVKTGLRLALPTMMEYMNTPKLSGQCARSLTKLIGALSGLKLWAVQMLDATSKPPAGLLEGTLTDFGDFDQCLAISVPLRNGKEDFRGKYCAMEAHPDMPPIQGNFSLAKLPRAGPLDTVIDEMVVASGAFYYLKFRFGACVPSSCSVEDIRALVSNVATMLQVEIKVPQCYVKESVNLKPVHIAVICVVIILLLVAIAGTAVDVKSSRDGFAEKKPTTLQSVLLAFSLSSNYRRLISKSEGSKELKSLHGIRALSIAWVMLGHTYVYTSFQLLRRPVQAYDWFNQLDMEPILNGWLSVEPFFFLSGLLTCYAGIQVMTKTKGKVNIPIFILRRYVRLTPPMLLVMGLTFFLPVISSGPFWYEKIDPELKSCENYWWKNLLYITNWGSVEDICVHPTWYLSADFQLHIFSLLILIPLYRSPIAGLSMMALATLAGNIAVGVLTYTWDLPPTIQISSGNDQGIIDTVNVVHIRTFTHIGSYCVGMMTGYMLVKKKGFELGKLANLVGWCCSIIAALAAVYGAHRWNSGDPHGQVLTCLYAAMHRTTFIIGVAWVAFTCVRGCGGLINDFLSSSMLAPFGRLTFNMYLLHSLVIWTRMASLRERIAFSHYNLLYEYCGTLIVTTLVAIPCYLLVEAPITNLDRLMFSRVRSPAKEAEESVNKVSNTIPSTGTGFSSCVQLTSIKSDLESRQR